MPRFRCWRRGALENSLPQDSPVEVVTVDEMSSRALSQETSVINESVITAGLEPSAMSIEQASPKTRGKGQGHRAKAKAVVPRSRPNAKPKAKAAPKARPMPIWGRCAVCQRAMIVKVRQSNGHPFLSCPRYPACTYACSVPASLSDQLPDRYVVCRQMPW